MLHRISPAVMLTLAACASAPPPPSQSPRDPSNPQAEETPVARVASATENVGAPAATTDAGVTSYACSMHPDVTASEPGHHCPKCGMELVPRRSAP
jgi:hypothetical protein